jgi:hypothetical protein
MGSPAVASFAAHVLFWMLVAWGTVTRELSWRGAVVFVALWLLSSVGLDYVPNGPALFSPVVAVLDVILVLVVFKGDVRLT